MTSSMIACVIATAAISVSSDATESVEALPFDGPPAPAALSREWKDARLVYVEDFEHGVDGAYPGRWRLRISQWPKKDSPSDFLRIRRLQDSARALQVRGLDGGEGGLDFDLTWDPKIVGGLLRVGFDVRATHGEKARMRLGVADVREQAAPGMGEPEETGPSLRVQWPGGTWSTRDFKRQDVPLPVEKLEAGRWYRLAVVADMGRNQFELFVDGGRVAADVPFADFRWFKGADRLSFQATHLMLDNIAVLHLPASTPQPNGTGPPPLTIRARKLSRAPQLDGRLDDEAWTEAYHTDRFYVTTGEPWREPRIEFWLGFRDDALYAATRVWPRKIAGQEQWTHTMEELKERYRDWKGGFGWEGYDAIHLLIIPGGVEAPGRYVRLGYNPGCGSGQKDSDVRDWHGRWQIATHMDEQSWSAEVRVPFADLTAGMTPTRVWGINVYRAVSGMSAEPHAMLTTASAGDGATHAFANLVGLGPAATPPPLCRLELPDPIYTGGAQLQVRISTGATPLPGEHLEVEIVAHGHKGAVVRSGARIRVTADKDRILPVDLPIELPGDYDIEAIVRPAGREGDEGEHAPILGRTSRLYAHVLPLGGLKARTDLNYYTHERSARIRVTRHGEPVPAGSTVRLRVRSRATGTDADDTKGRPVLTELDRSAGASPFVVDLPLAGLPVADLQLELHLIGPDAGVLAATSLSLTRRPAKHNEVKIRWDNVMIVNGRPFFPVFIWNSDPPIAHHLGANTLLCTAAYLSKYNLWEECRRFGIYLIARDWQFPYVNEYLDQFEADPSSFRGTHQDQPTLLAYFVEDEPRTTKDGKAAPHIIRTANAIRAMDPYHPTVISEEIGWTRAFAYSPIVEVIGQHIYPSSGPYQERTVAEQTAMMVRITRGEKPIWQTMQGFHYKVSRKHPTPLEFRHATYSALVHGATGLGLWGIHHREGFPGEDIRGLTSDKALFAQVRETFHAVQRLSPVLISDEPVDAPATIDNDRIAIRTRRWRGHHYVWLVNMTRDEQTATLVLPTVRGRLTNEIEPGGEWPIEGGRCELKVGPLQPMVLKASE